jgi:anti-sigma factor RsiW
MARTARPVTESDLLAYVDGRLDAARRGEVEDHLLRHPEDRLRIAADLAIAEGLRLLFGRPRPAMRHTVRRRAYSFPA